MSRVVKFIERESGMLIARGWGEGDGESLFNGHEVQFCKMKKFWRLAVHQCECT